MQAKSHPDLARDNQFTALHAAARVEDPAALKVLLEHKANVRARCMVDGYEPLHMAAHFDRLESAQLLLAAKAELEAPNETGNSPLGLAAAYLNTPALVTFLLEQKV